MIYRLNREQLYVLLVRAYKAARANERNDESQLAFEMDLEKNLVDLLNELWSRTYVPHPGFVFMISVPVKREVFASEFRDRIVQHLLFDFLEPIFEPTFIYDSYSCRKGKGTLFAINRMEQFTRSVTENWTRRTWCLLIDISGYFMSIDKRILFDMITRHIMKGAAVYEKFLDIGFVIWLTDKLINRDAKKGVHFISDRSSWKNFPERKSMLNNPWWQGLPIGDLDSQLSSNIYLGVQDDFVKRELRVRYYGRYVDDSRGLSRDRGFLEEVLAAVTEFDRDVLHLSVHPHKSEIIDVREGVPFIGAMIMPFRTYCSNRTYARCLSVADELERICLETDNRAELQSVMDRTNSYLGYLRHLREHKLMQHLTSGEGMRKWFDVADDLTKVTFRKERKVIECFEPAVVSPGYVIDNSMFGLPNELVTFPSGEYTARMEDLMLYDLVMAGEER